jgi:hypothetical protein
MITALMNIRREHGLTTAQLAQAAHVPLRVVYLCEIGGWVDEADAGKVAQALSRLVGKLYTLEMLEVNLKTHVPEDDPTFRFPAIGGPPRIDRK